MKNNILKKKQIPHPTPKYSLVSRSDNSFLSDQIVCKTYFALKSGCSGKVYVMNGFALQVLSAFFKQYFMSTQILPIH